jgi:hypothetical protein
MLWKGSLDRNHGNLNKASSPSRADISFYRYLWKEAHEDQAFLASKFRDHWKTPSPSQGFSDSKREKVIIDS